MSKITFALNGAVLNSVKNKEFWDVVRREYCPGISKTYIKPDYMLQNSPLFAEAMADPFRMEEIKELATEFLKDPIVEDLGLEFEELSEFDCGNLNDEYYVRDAFVDWCVEKFS